MPFLTEAEPARGEKLPILPNVSRIVAGNPGPMTYHGTNTYLIETPAGTVVLDPGPEGHSDHVQAILRHTGGRIALILVSHTHGDHIGAIPELLASVAAPTAGYARSATASFAPEIRLEHGTSIHGLTALHTPGHAADHLCFALMAETGEKVLFSADHVMSWSTSVVSPPQGNMRDYFASLDLLMSRADELYLPGHGPPLAEPRTLVREMLVHRRMREHALLARLRRGAEDIPSLVRAQYAQLNPKLHKAAERNVLAHLLKLEAEDKVVQDGTLWRAC